MRTAAQPVAAGAWFSFDNKLLYLSVQAEKPRVSHIIAVQGPSTWNRPIG
jgi:hypothetical protein